MVINAHYLTPYFHIFKAHFKTLHDLELILLIDYISSSLVTTFWLLDRSMMAKTDQSSRTIAGNEESAITIGYTSAILNLFIMVATKYLVRLSIKYKINCA